MLLIPPNQTQDSAADRLASNPALRFLLPQSKRGRGWLLAILLGLFLIIWAMGSFSEALIAVWGGFLFPYLPLRMLFVIGSEGVQALRHGWQERASRASAVQPASAPVVASASPAPKELFLNVAGSSEGPYSLEEVRGKLTSGAISESDYAWKEGWMGWRKITDLAELQGTLPPPLPPINQAASGTSPQPNASRSSAPASPNPKSSTLHMLLKYGTICFCSLLGFILIAAVLFGSGTSPATNVESTGAAAPAPPPPPPQPLRPEQIAERLRQSTVRIDAGFKVQGLIIDDTYSWLGSGVVFEKSEGVYWILSNAHVVGSESICNSKLFMDPVVLQYALVVTMPDGKRVKPSAVLINRHLKDFAVIGVPASTGNYAVLPFGKAQLPQGQKVFAMGHPMGLDGTFTSGVISSWRTMNTKLGKPYEVIQTDATINAGNSGGPLVDDFANLIGINTFTMYRDQNAQGLNFAVSAGEIARSIKANELVTFPLEPNRIGPFVVQLNRGGIR